MPNCTICSLPKDLRDEINQMLYDKVKQRDICMAAARQGHDISRTAISRHKKNHMSGFEPEPSVKELEEKIASVPPPPKISYTTPDDFKKLSEGTDLIQCAIDERRASQLMLEGILQNQLSIVAGMQTEYMQNDGEYPRDQVQGLKTLMGLLDNFPAYTNYRHGEKSIEMDSKAAGGEYDDKVDKELSAMFDLDI